MYDGDAMTQIFKRTKKCCAKLIRKLSFNTTTPVNIPIKLRNPARYVQEKNKTCTQENLSRSENGARTTATVNDGSWDLVGNERLTSRTNTNNGLSDDGLSYEDEDYQMFHISSPFFFKRDMTTTSYSRVDNRCKRNCNFPPRLITSNLMTSMLLSRRDLGKFKKSNNNNSCCSDEEIVSSMKDSGDILLTEGKLQSEVMFQVLGNESKNIKSCTIGRNAITRNGQNQYVDFHISNAKWTGNRCNEVTTSFIVPQDLTEKFDSNLNLSSSFTAPTSEGCTGVAAKKAFAKQANNTNDPIDSKARSQIVFEKVKYDKNKKYLRHTPTNSSVGSVASSPNSLCNGRLIPSEHSPSSFSLENSSSDNVLCSSISCLPSSELVWKHYNSSYEPNEKNCYHLSIDSNPDEAINRINSLRRKYSETWDGNGNSADSRRILCDEAWDIFDNKINSARDKKMLILYPDGEDFISPRSSSTTLETWVDDEIFDNSFNEELERSCPSFER